VEVALRASGTGAELAVHNRGPAIPAELVDKIFEPLERVELASTNHSIGLGLYIVQQIIAAHGGTITVESSDDVGTVFCVRLPAEAA
jgi:signal transduction histidine kinase